MSEHDRRAELSQFLRSRRARLKPEDVDLPSYGRRRVPGLRREELAQLAGVSFTYYSRLEQGYGEGMSAAVLDAVAHALKLTEAERLHLFQLADFTRPGAPEIEPQWLRPGLQHLLDALGVPAFVTGRCMNVLGWNRLAATVFGDLARLPPHERNWPRLMFLSPATRDRFVELDQRLRVTVGLLRLHHGRYPNDQGLTSLVAELSRESEEFRRLWARYEVGCENNGVLRLRHPLVGEFELVAEPLALPGDADQRLQAYYAEPGSTSEKALRVLAEHSSRDAAVDRA